MIKCDRLEEQKLVIISPKGEIDLYNVPDFKKIAVPVAGKDLVIDCDGLDFIDSTGLGSLVSIHKKATELGSSFRIINLKPHLYKVFDLTGLGRLFCLEETK